MSNLNQPIEQFVFPEFAKPQPPDRSSDKCADRYDEGYRDGFEMGRRSNPSLCQRFTRFFKGK